MPPAVLSLFSYARSVINLPLKARDQVIGVLRIDSDRPNAYSVYDAELAWALANQAAVAIENARLYDRAREVAAYEERQRLSRELHDSVTQTLWPRWGCWGGPSPRSGSATPPRDARPSSSLDEMTQSALAEMRTLCLELRPAAILQSGLDELLPRLAGALRTHLEKPIAVEIEGSAGLPPDVHLVFYRIAQAALGNVVRHAPLPRRGRGWSSATPPRCWRSETTGAPSPRRSANDAAWGSRSCASGPRRSAPTS